MFQHDSRVTYQKLKEWALDAYYNFCRDSGLAQGKSHEHVMARVDYTFEGGFERPVENLMWRVILLILSGGWHRDWEAHARQTIIDQIAKYGLDSLLLDVPSEEAELFRHDLRVISLL